MALSAESCWPEHARSPENTTATFVWMKNKSCTAGRTYVSHMNELLMSWEQTLVN